MEYVVVLYGRMEFTDDEAIVYEVQEARYMQDSNEIDDYMIDNHFSGYLIPSQYNGKIIFKGINHDSKRLN